LREAKRTGLSPLKDSNIYKKKTDRLLKGILNKVRCTNTAHAIEPLRIDYTNLCVNTISNHTQTSDEKVTFDKAELACVPFPVNSLYKSQLMWSENPLHLDFVARLVNETHNTHEYWVGLDKKSGGLNWKSR
jgi:hypothetical protein